MAENGIIDQIWFWLVVMVTGSGCSGEHRLAPGTEAVRRVRGVAAAAGAACSGGGHRRDAEGAFLAYHAPWRGRESKRESKRESERARARMRARERESNTEVVEY